MYTIDIANQQSLLDVDESLLRHVVERTLSAEQTAAAEISVALVDDQTIRVLNQRHLGHDYPTDVLSFLFDGDPGGERAWTSALPQAALRGRGRQIDGEVIVSVEMAMDRAAAADEDPHAELALYLVHGLLHLLGYDDAEDDERRLMRSRERDMLQLCELAPGVDS